MTIYIKRKKDCFINGYTVATGIPQEGEFYNIKVVAWFKTMKEAIGYAEYLILNHPFGKYTEIFIGKDEEKK